MEEVDKYMQEIGIDLLRGFSAFKYLNMNGCISSVLNYLAKGSCICPKWISL